MVKIHSDQECTCLQIVEWGQTGSGPYSMAQVPTCIQSVSPWPGARPADSCRDWLLLRAHEVDARISDSRQAAGFEQAQQMLMAAVYLRKIDIAQIGH